MAGELLAHRRLQWDFVRKRDSIDKICSLDDAHLSPSSYKTIKIEMHSGGKRKAIAKSFPFPTVLRFCPRGNDTYANISFLYTMITI